jgi:hypothetical protein
MAAFCSNCGNALGVNSAFCGKCGAAAGNRPNAPGAAPPAAANYQPAVSGSGGGTALKIIIILLCVLVVGGVAVVGGVYYLAHRAKQIIVQKAAEEGVDLNSIGNASASGESGRRHLPKPCEVLSKERVAELIGQPIERAERQDAMCLYYGPSGLSAKLAQEQASGTFNRAQAPRSTVGGTEVANSVDQLVNSLAAQSGQTGSGGESPLLMIGLDADGKAQMTAVTATRAIFDNLGKAADGKGGLGFGADIPGLGDKAVRVPKLGLNVLAGETLIRIIPGPIPDSDNKTIAVARAVLPKI